MDREEYTMLWCTHVATNRFLYSHIPGFVEPTYFSREAVAGRNDDRVECRLQPLIFWWNDNSKREQQTNQTKWDENQINGESQIGLPTFKKESKKEKSLQDEPLGLLSTQ